MEDTDLIFNDTKESVFYLGGIMFCGSVSKGGGICHLEGMLG